MQAVPQPSGRLRFGVFEVDLRAGELRKQGMRVRLQEQPFQVLAILLARPGELVTREELQRKLWPADTFVDFDHGLNKAINKIRDALADSAESPRFVETVARRGYRFLAEVRIAEASPMQNQDAANQAPSQANIPDTPDPAREPPRPRQPSSRLWKTIVVSLALTSILAVVIVRLRDRSAPRIHSLAVLPLESLSADHSQDYFADGMTDELTTDLGQISALRVISRTSAMAYRGAHKPLPEIARELNVDAVVEGTVLRSGSRVRITAQLIEGSDDRHLWAKSYEGDLRDTLALQKDVARAIADEVRISLTPQEQTILKARRPVNPEAYEAYLRGRYFWNK